MPPTNAANWTEAEDEALQDGLQRYPHTLDKNERWTCIAACVATRSKKECVARFKEIRAALMATTAGGGETAGGVEEVETAKRPPEMETAKAGAKPKTSQPSVTPSLLIPGQAVDRTNHRRASGDKVDHGNGVVKRSDQKGKKKKGPTNDADNAADDDKNAAAAKKKRSRRKKKKGGTGTGGDESGGEKVAELPSAEDRQSANHPKQQQREGGGRNNKKTKNDKKSTSNSKNNSGRGGKFAWRDEIPQGAVDPISLDPLVELPYPPFALVATAPYDVVSEWPVSPEEERRLALGVSAGGGAAGGGAGGGGDGKATEQKRIADRELDVIRQQWGDAVAASASAFSAGADGATESESKADTKRQVESAAEMAGRRYYHLFDGQVLAYYLVSQLQFIDPLNRRDLTRAELKNLDAYLKRHRLGKAKVTEAYDARGLTVSSAGVAGQTDEGRAEILQQEARTLLGSLFSGDSHAQGSAAARQQQLEARARATPRFDNQFQRHYQESERRQQRGGRGRGRGGGGRRSQQGSGTTSPIDHLQDPGIYAAEEGGLIIYDDDANPGLRGGLEAASASAQRHQEQTGRGDGGNNGAGPNTFYSSSHIANRYGHASRVRADNFPALQTTSADDTFSSSATSAVAAAASPKTPPKPNKGPSKSLMKISKIVQKTDLKELAKQKQATEAARKRAAMANLSFQVVQGTCTGVSGDGIGAAVPAVNATAVTTSGGGTAHAPSEGQLERNRAMASALGVKPSTMRNNFNSGWARPTVVNIELDEFGNELNAAQYPDALIMEAKERMTEVLKLERKWKTFLADDKSSSQPLRAMPRDLRKFCHEYSDFWNLHTESFDPEPRRYIHCTKMRDTSAPHPLLSEAARKWKGPGTGAPALPPVRPASQDDVHVGGHQPPPPSISGHGAVASTTAREFTVTEERKPLKLEPRTLPPGQVLAEENGARANDEWEDHEPAERFSSLALGEKERTKLNLAPRTKALELPAYQQNEKFDAAKTRERIDRERKEKQEKQRKKEEKKRNILASAFASDSEDEDSGSDSSDWGEQDAVFEGSDGEW